ncbi:MAG: glycosyltransferase [Kiritimatiellae bacterium]|nr:glycosyltransferase [Kiritimatiellia bacterium]
MQTLAIVIPCHNEALRLDSTAFIRAAETWPWISFCFVDDGSTDATAELLAHLSQLSPAMHAIYLSRNMGKAEAVRAGVRHILANTHADLVGFWDADLAAPLEEIPSFMAAFERPVNPPAAVFGSRWPHLGTDIRRSGSRGFASILAKAAIRRVLGVQVWDTQCGAKIFSRALAAEVFRDKFRTKWLFDVEILARIGKRRLKKETMELPLTVWYDVPGSKVGISALFELVWLIFARAMRRENWYNSVDACIDNRR